MCCRFTLLCNNKKDLYDNHLAAASNRSKRQLGSISDPIPASPSIATATGWAAGMGWDTTDLSAPVDARPDPREYEIEQVLTVIPLVSTTGGFSRCNSVFLLLLLQINGCEFVIRFHLSLFAAEVC